MDKKQEYLNKLTRVVSGKDFNELMTNLLKEKDNVVLGGTCGLVATNDMKFIEEVGRTNWYDDIDLFVEKPTKEQFKHLDKFKAKYYIDENATIYEHQRILDMVYCIVNDVRYNLIFVDEVGEKSKYRITDRRAFYNIISAYSTEYMLEKKEGRGTDKDKAWLKDFYKATGIKQKHQHYDAIIAWANGAVIEYRASKEKDIWLKCWENQPLWNKDTVYRVAKN